MRLSLVICALFAALPAAAATPAFVNGSFEQGLAGWQRSGLFYAQLSAKAHDGYRVAAFGAAESVIGIGNTKGTLYQTVTLPATPQYTLVFWASIATTETAAAVRDTLALDILTSTGSLLSTPLTLSNRDASSAFVRYAIPLAAYAGKSVRVQFRGQVDAANPTVFQLDAVSLEQIVGPTSIEGVITSAATGAKIKDALVSFGGISAPSLADGSYKLANVPCTAGVLRVVAVGYVTAEVASYRPNCGASNRRDVALALPPTTLLGRVWDSSTNANLINVHVTFAGAEQVTASDGTYVFPSVPCQAGSIVAQTPEFALWRLDGFTPKCGTSNRIDIPLVPQLTAILGYVSETPSGRAIAGAEVTFGNRKTTTNDRGLYLLTAVASTPAVMTVAAPGYQTSATTVSPIDQQTIFATTQLVANVTTISGRIIDRFTATSIPTATVRLDNNPTAPANGGNYTLLAYCGTVGLTVEAPGYQKLVMAYETTCGTANQLDLQLAPLPPVPSLCGRVGADIGGNIAGVKVDVGSRSTVTDANGAYCIGALVCGGSPVNVHFSRAGYLDSDKSVNVVCGQMNALDANLHERTIEGSVIDAEVNAPIPGAAIAYGNDATTTGDGGAFTFHGFCRGDTIVVTKAGYRPYSADVNAAMCSSIRPVIPAIKLQPSATNVFVTLLDKQAPIRDAFVKWRGTFGTPDGQGGYAFTATLCQSASLVAFAPRYKTAPVALTAICDHSILQPVGLTPVRTTISGSVRDGIHGGALQGATVTWQSATVTTDANGRFSLVYVPCANGTLTIAKSGYKTITPSVNADCTADVKFSGDYILGQ